MLAYELARRHYLIQRQIETTPGTHAFLGVARELKDLSLPHLYALWVHDAEAYTQVIPLFLLARRTPFNRLQESAPSTLQSAINTLRNDFLGTLLQEQERLIQDAQLFRYPYGRYLLLEHMRDWQSWDVKQASGIPDRDNFRQYLGAYVQIVQGLHPTSHLLEIWNQTAWLQRWQINDSPRQELPTQQSLRKQIEKYKLPERGKRLYAELDPGIQHQEVFLDSLAEVFPQYVGPMGQDSGFQQELEARLREVIQVSLRHTMKKGFRAETVARHLANQSQRMTQHSSPETQSWVFYIVVQELILGTQNLKYRLNDVLNGIAQSQMPQCRAICHSILDSVMEIYESFSLADNALKSFLDQQAKSQALQEHTRYTERIAKQKA